MKYRLLYVVPDFHPNISGYANACTGLVHALSSSLRYSIDVLTFSPLGGAAELVLPGVRIHRLSRKRLLGSMTLGSEFELSKLMATLDKREGYDFIFFETAEFPLAQLNAIRLFGNRVILRIHACAETEWILFRRDFHYIWKRLPTRMFISKVKNIFSTTPYYLGYVKHWFLSDDPLKIASKRFYVVPNAIPEVKTLGREGRGSQDDCNHHIRLMTLGRMDYQGELQKNFSRVLAAISLLRDRPYFQSLQIMVVGDGCYRDTLISLARELEIDDVIVFTGVLPNDKVLNLQANCEGVILASTFEGMSVFALEALASGAPLLVSGNGGLRGLVDDGENGVIIENPFDIDEISEKINYFIENLIPDIDLLRQKSRQKFDREFSHRAVEECFARAIGVVSAYNRSKAF